MEFLEHSYCLPNLLYFLLVFLLLALKKQVRRYMVDKQTHVQVSGILLWKMELVVMPEITIDAILIFSLRDRYETSGSVIIMVMHNAV